VTKPGIILFPFFFSSLHVTPHSLLLSFSGESKKYTEFKTKLEKDIRDRVAQKCDCTPKVKISSVSLDQGQEDIGLSVETASLIDVEAAMKGCSYESQCLLGGGKVRNVLRVYGVPKTDNVAKEEDSDAGDHTLAIHHTGCR